MWNNYELNQQCGDHDINYLKQWDKDHSMVPKEKEYDKAVFCHLAYLTYMQSTSWETLGWKKHKLE